MSAPAHRPGARYVIVTPARDEADHLGAMVEYLARQTLVPTEWVVVDDGSTDATGAIADAAAESHEWITVVHRRDRGFRAAGSGVMEAFADGTAALRAPGWDYLVKLDGDLELPPDYFERCLAHFDADAELGIGGGVIHNVLPGGRTEEERHPAFHVRGATKIYRRACWDVIAPLPAAPGWDTLDEVLANYHGWRTRSFPELVLVQHRFTGDAAGQWRNWVKNGRANWLVGYDPVFLVARALRRLTQRYPLRSAAGLLVGYFGAALRREPPIAPRAVRRYLRREQRARLLGRPSIWR